MKTKVLKKKSQDRDSNFLDTHGGPVIYMLFKWMIINSDNGMFCIKLLSEPMQIYFQLDP